MTAPLDATELNAVRLVLGDIMTGNRMMANLHVLCDIISNRPAGSVAEAATRDFLVGEFERIGLARVTSEPFPAPHWKRGTTVANIRSPIERRIELLALPLNRRHHVTAEVAPVSFRTESEFLRIAPQLNGRICVNRGETVTGAGKEVLHRAERIRLAHQAGAAAFLWASHLPGQLLPTGSMDPEIANDMPAFGITLEDALLIERLTAEGSVTMDVETNNELDIGTSWNVVGDLPGTSPQAPWVYLTAHYDSHDITTGAYDNAAGCAIVLECARSLAAHYSGSGCNFRFVIFSAEEVGLAGSKHYAREHEAHLPMIRFLLNADGLGVAPSTKYIHVPFHEAAAEYLRDTFSQYGYTVDVDNAVNLNWDHAAFAVRGTPVGSITAKGVPGRNLHYGHTRADTLDKIDPQDMRYAACCSALLAYTIAVDQNWPISHLDEEAVSAALNASGKNGALETFM